MNEITKKYSNGDITVVWKPRVCIHSTLCWKGEKGLRTVFNPTEKPWIKPEAAPSIDIIERVNQCPSGALSFYYNDAEEKNAEQTFTEHRVEVIPNGPLLVHGNISVKHIDGDEVQKNKTTAFCRCGKSANKPYCDGTHIKTGFAD